MARSGEAFVIIRKAFGGSELYVECQDRRGILHNFVAFEKNATTIGNYIQAGSWYALDFTKVARGYEEYDGELIRANFIQ